MTHTSAPGKMVLLGEYVVLEGAPALVAAVDRRAHATCAKAAGFSLDAPTLHLHQAAFVLSADGIARFDDPATDARADLAMVRAALRHAARKTPLVPCAIHIDTRAFAGGDGHTKLGIGSSAAACTALMAALLLHHGVLEPAMLNSPPHQQALLQLAHEAHSEAQGGRGSGVDVAASVLGGLSRFERSRSDNRLRAASLRPWLTMAVVPIDTGHAASTAAMLRHVQALKLANPTLYWQIYEKLAIYAHAGHEFWALGKAEPYLSVIESFTSTLASLGEAAGTAIITPAHATLAALVKEAGGAYKPSGAGGGDLGVAFCPSEKVARRVRARVPQAGFALAALNIDDVGVCLEPSTLRKKP